LAKTRDLEIVQTKSKLSSSNVRNGRHEHQNLSFKKIMPFYLTVTSMLIFGSMKYLRFGSSSLQ
jgi:hypothetical protein